MDNNYTVDSQEELVQPFVDESFTHAQYNKVSDSVEYDGFSTTVTNSYYKGGGHG